MGVKKYTAATMQKALKSIREELGDDAIILSNRKLPNGKVEITVSMDAEPAPVAESRAIVPTSQPAYSEHQQSNSYSTHQSIEPLSLSNEKAKQLLAAVRTSQHASQSNTQTLNATPAGRNNDTQQGYSSPGHSPSSHSPSAHMQGPSVSADMSTFFQNTVIQMQQEISELKRQMQMSQQPQVLPEPLEPQHKSKTAAASHAQSLTTIHRQWRHIGLDDALLKKFQKTPAFESLKHQSDQVLWSACLKHLQSLIPRYSRNAVENPGVYAFVGSTGAGKTTTLGKLAVRQVNRWGANNVGIVTMDSFRIGAWEQMQRLGDIIGVKTALCRQEDSLMDTLAQMRECRFILIDTAGLSHQDERRIAQWQKLDELGDELETYLVAQANLQPTVLQQLTKAYEPAHIRGIIYTKCDEVTSLGEAVSALIHAELPWVFACDGQRIPEDLKVMSVNAVMQMLATTAKQKRWNLGGHASEQEAILVKAMG